MVTVGAIVLEWARGVDDEIGCEALQGVGNVAPVEGAGNRARLAPETGVEGFGAGEVAAADQQFEIGEIGQPFGKAPAEDAIPAWNQHPTPTHLRPLIEGGEAQEPTPS